MEIDHVFVCCARGAPEADALLQLGLREGPGNVHAGQGTANRRFFFANAYLELLWVADESEVRSTATRRTRLWERWSARDAGASPFGIVLRPSSEGERPPFPTWPYRPAYLPADTAIEFADDVPLHEPELVCLPFVRYATRRAAEIVGHALPLRRLHAVRVGVPDTTTLSAASRAACAAVPLDCVAGEFVMDLAFDGGTGRVHDLRPTLPLRLRGD